LFLLVKCFPWRKLRGRGGSESNKAKEGMLPRPASERKRSCSMSGEGTEVHLTLDASMMVVKVPDYSRAFEVNADKMVPGVAVSNSEVGVLAFSIEAYFYRLVCTNGLISKTQVASKFRHVSLKALEEFNAILSQVVHESQFNQGNLAISAGVDVDNPLGTIGSFNRRFQLTKKEGEAVERSWQLEPENTMWSVINAYTRGAQEPELSSEEANKLERVGGQILSLIQH